MPDLAPGRGVDDAAGLHASKAVAEVVDLDGYVTAKRRFVFPLGEVKLLLIVDLVELSRVVELERRERLETELLLVELAGLGEVVDHQGHVVDAQHSWHGLTPARCADSGVSSFAD